MALSLVELRRLAVDVAKDENPALEVIGATVAEGGQCYVEVVAALDRDAERQPIVIGLNRDLPEETIRNQFREGLRDNIGGNQNGDHRRSAPAD